MDNLFGWDHRIPVIKNIYSFLEPPQANIYSSSVRDKGKTCSGTSHTLWKTPLRAGTSTTARRLDLFYPGSSSGPHGPSAEPKAPYFRLSLRALRPLVEDPVKGRVRGRSQITEILADLCVGSSRGRVKHNPDIQLKAGTRARRSS